MKKGDSVIHIGSVEAYVVKVVTMGAFYAIIDERGNQRIVAKSRLHPIPPKLEFHEIDKYAKVLWKLEN